MSKIDQCCDCIQCVASCFSRMVGDIRLDAKGSSFAGRLGPGRHIALLTALLLTGCVQSHYEFDREQANARLKARVMPTERSETWKTHDQVVDLFPKNLNLPHYKDFAGRVLQPPRVLDAGRPVYSADLIEAHMEGHVLVVVVISTQGTVIDARVVQSSNRLLNSSAVACARRWKFSPATIDGRPTNYVFALPIDFKVRHH